MDLFDSYVISCILKVTEVLGSYNIRTWNLPYLYLEVLACSTTLCRKVATEVKDLFLPLHQFRFSEPLRIVRKLGETWRGVVIGKWRQPKKQTQLSLLNSTFVYYWADPLKYSIYFLYVQYISNI